VLARQPDSRNNDHTTRVCRSRVLAGAAIHCKPPDGDCGKRSRLWERLEKPTSLSIASASAPNMLGHQLQSYVLQDDITTKKYIEP
jgi:hypothetical protein